MYTSVMLAFGAVSRSTIATVGEGQRVDASLLAGNMYGASLDLQAFLAIGGERFLKPTSRLDAGNPMSGTNYPTSDGVWVTLDDARDGSLVAAARGDHRASTPTTRASPPTIFAAASIGSC